MKIEKGISVPPVLHSGGAKKGTKRAIWHKMEIVDSVLIGSPGDKSDKYTSQQAYARKCTGWKFTSRTVPEGVRIWRTA